MSIRQRDASDDTGGGAERHLVLRLLEGSGADGLPGLEGFLGRAVDLAARLIGATYAAVGLVEPGAGQRIGLVVHTGADAGAVEVVRAPPEHWGLTTLLRSAHGEPPVLPGCPDARSMLVVPVPGEGAPVGFLCLVDPRQAPEFSGPDSEATRALAATIGLRVEQERRSEHHRRRADWLAASLRITSDLVASDSPDQALREVSDLAREVSGADAAWIKAGGSADELALVAVSRGPSVPEVEHGLHADLTRRVAERGQPERVPAGVDDQLAVVVPLRSPSGLFGSMTLTWAAHRRADFEAVPTELPASFAEQAVLALEVARSREVRGRLQVFEERDRIARDLHDVVLQDLFATALELQMLARDTADPESRRGLELAASELQLTSRNIRRSIFGLGVLERGGDLRAEVTRLVQRANAALKLDVDLHVDGLLETIDPDVGTDLVAVLAEALSNATRHSGAGSVWVRIDVGTTVRLSVSDDGIGIPADATLSGLDNMRQRAERHGGRMTLGRGHDGVGTRVTWTVPSGSVEAVRRVRAPASGPPGHGVLRDVSAGASAPRRDPSPEAGAAADLAHGPGRES